MLLASPALADSNSTQKGKNSSESKEPKGSAQTNVNAHMVDGLHASDIIAAAATSSSGAIDEIVEAAKSSSAAAVTDVSSAAKASTAAAISDITQVAESSATPAIDAAAVASRAATQAVEAANDAADAASLAAVAALQAAEAAKAAAAGAAVSMPEGIPPSWHQILPGDKRFELVLNDEAVLDKETGLVWERSPSQESQYYSDWQGAYYANYVPDYCANLMVGGRMGWSVPTAQQLASLVDTSTYFSGEPTLPAGHPFDTDCSSGGCVAPARYFTSTVFLNRTDPSKVVTYDFSQGVAVEPRNIGGDYTPYKNRMWCVRSGATPPARY